MSIPVTLLTIAGVGDLALRDRGWGPAVLDLGGMALLVLLGWVVLRPKADFRITVSGSEVTFRGKLPVVRQAEIANFLRDEVAPPGKLVVSGKWMARRVLRVTVRGAADKGEEQRIRNFLKMALRG